MGTPPTTSTPPATAPRPALAAAGAALQIGVIADLLLRVGPPGLNFSLLLLAAVALFLAVARRARTPIGWEGRVALLAGVAFALAIAVRDTEALVLYDLVALVPAMAILAASARRARPSVLLSTTVAGHLADVRRMIISFATGAWPLARLCRPDGADSSERPHRAVAVAAVRGLALAAVPLVVFAALLAGADPVFESMLGGALRFDPGEAISHVVLAGVFAWLAGGYLYGALIARDDATVARTAGRSMARPALGAIELGIPLALLDLLFLLFVAVQVRTFLGGEAIVQATAGLTYAEYARRGFFELVFVSALAFPVILAAAGVAAPGDRRARRVVRSLGGVMVVLLLAIMVSAAARMRLYVDVYGFTIDRVLASVFMGWLAMMFLWLAATVLRGRARYFVAGGLVSGWATLLALHAADPAGLVVRANIARAAEGRNFDALHAVSLGGDAVPDLVRYLVTTPAPAEPPRTQPEWNDAQKRCVAARRLLDRWGPTQSTDWRTWTLGRARARAAVNARAAELGRMACTPGRS